MAYARTEDVAVRMMRTLSEKERAACEVLLEDIAVLIDRVNEHATADQATLTYTEGNATKTLNLFQRNMFAVRAEIEVGFRADLTAFNLLTTPVA